MGQPPRQQDSGGLSAVPVGVSGSDSDLNSIKHHCPAILVDRSWVQNPGFPSVRTTHIKPLGRLRDQTIKVMMQALGNCGQWKTWASPSTAPSLLCCHEFGERREGNGRKVSGRKRGMGERRKF